MMYRLLVGSILILLCASCKDALVTQDGVSSSELLNSAALGDMGDLSLHGCSDDVCDPSDVPASGWLGTGELFIKA